MSEDIEHSEDTLDRGSSKEYIKYLSEHKDDNIAPIIKKFPLINSKELVFANLNDRRQRLALSHDMQIALLYQRAQNTRDLDTMEDYWMAKVLLDARITRSQGEYRDRILAASNIVENRTKPIDVEESKTRTRSALRRLFSI